MKSRRLKRLVGCLMVVIMVLSQATTSAFAVTEGQGGTGGEKGCDKRATVYITVQHKLLVEGTLLQENSLAPKAVKDNEDTWQFEQGELSLTKDADQYVFNLGSSDKYDADKQSIAFYPDKGTQLTAGQPIQLEGNTTSYSRTVTLWYDKKDVAPANKEIKYTVEHWVSGEGEPRKESGEEITAPILEGEDSVNINPDELKLNEDLIKIGYTQDSISLGDTPITDEDSVAVKDGDTIRIYYSQQQQSGKYTVEHWLLGQTEDKKLEGTKEVTGALVNNKVNVNKDYLEKKYATQYNFVEYRVGGNMVSEITSVDPGAKITICYREKPECDLKTTVRVTVNHELMSPEDGESSELQAPRTFTKQVKNGQNSWQFADDELVLENNEDGTYILSPNASDRYDVAKKSITTAKGEGTMPLVVGQAIEVEEGKTDVSVIVTLRYNKKGRQGTYTVNHWMDDPTGLGKHLAGPIEQTGSLIDGKISVVSGAVKKLDGYTYSSYRIDKEAKLTSPDIIGQVDNRGTINIYYSAKEEVAEKVEATYTVVHKGPDGDNTAPSAFRTTTDPKQVEKDTTGKAWLDVDTSLLNAKEEFTNAHYVIDKITADSTAQTQEGKPTRVEDKTIITVLYKKAEPTETIKYTVQYKDKKTDSLIAEELMPKGKSATNEYTKKAYSQSESIKVTTDSIEKLDITGYEFVEYNDSNVVSLPEVQNGTTIILYYNEKTSTPDPGNPTYEDVQYTVKHVTEDKSPIAGVNDTIVKGQVKKGDKKELTVTADSITPKSIDGYTYTNTIEPADIKAAQTIADGGTVYLFYKVNSGQTQETTKTLNYQVQYYLNNAKWGNAENGTVKVKSHISEIPMNDMIMKNINIINKISGATCQTTAEQLKAITIQDGTVINVYYAGNSPTPPSNPGEETKQKSKYTVEYYYEEGGEYPIEATAKTEREGIVDEKAVVTDADKVPAADMGDYTFDQYNPANVLESKINVNGTTVLKVYFTGGSQYYMDGTLNVTNEVYKDHEEWATDKTFYAGVFEDASCTTPVTDADGNSVIIPINMGGSYQAQASYSVPTTADGQSWYVTEVDADGSIMQETDLFKYTVGEAKVAAFSVSEGGTATVDMQNNFFTDTTGYYPGDGGSSSGETTTTTTTTATTTSNNAVTTAENNNDANAVQTGDDSDMMPYVMMMLIAGTIAAAALLRRKIHQ